MKKLFVLGLAIFSLPVFAQAAHHYRGTATNFHLLKLTTADGLTINTPILTFLYQKPNTKPITKIDKTVIDMTELEVKVDTSQTASFVKWVQDWQKAQNKGTAQGLLEIRDNDDNALHERVQLKDLQLENAVSSTVDDVPLLTVTFSFNGGKLMFRKTDDDDADDKKGFKTSKDDDDEKTVKSPKKDDDDDK
jgi:hypothetical protein